MATNLVRDLWVDLTRFQVAEIEHFAADRDARRKGQGCNPYGLAGGDPSHRHYLGVAGEVVVAYVLDRFPTGLFVDLENDDDVGGIQVRTRAKWGYELYAYPHEHHEFWFLCTMLRRDRICIRGWAHDHEVKAAPLRTYTTDTREAHFFSGQLRAFPDRRG